MSKKRITPIIQNDIQTEIEKIKMELGRTTEPLPTAAEVSEAIATVTNKPLLGTELKSGRPIKENAVGRSKFTTAVRSDVVKWLKTYAIETDQTAADVLETGLLNYRDEKNRNK